ncbi:MAG TPA: UvrD-helicase domain-containing protein [Terriglobia bacterium]|nr:UvrD-helicase domain-containing protein [Terriglobia bacterium]
MKQLADQRARDAIKGLLDRSMVVEAAAGTGKTTELVNRIVNVIAQGRARIDQIVAVTFTEKAAGELKLRLRSRLEEEQQAATSKETQLRLRGATAGLEEAHISTIHGFCADLLRERPVEAGVDPQFEALDEGVSQRLYDEAFGRWLETQLENPPEGIRRALRRPAREDPTERLRSAGWELVQWQDYPAPWRREPFARETEIDALIEKLHAFADLTANPTKPNDPFYEDSRRARRLAADIDLAERIRPPGERRDYDGLEGDFTTLATGWTEEVKKFRKPRSGYGVNYKNGLRRTEVQAAHAELLGAIGLFAKRADADLAALLHEELRGSIERYHELKVQAGRLDFLDLLVRARDLIRDCARVRAEFQQRLKCIFIDEFQDTDPLQVEILMLLASDNAGIANWREVTPAPGKLFIVGDPKQAIYRFRRADLGIYQRVKDQLSGRGGAHCLELTTSFRAVPSIQRAVNKAFEPLMNGDRDILQAAYVPLLPYRQDRSDQPALVALPVPAPYGYGATVRANKIEASLPDAIAAFVYWLIQESGWKVTESQRPGEFVPVAARHVCLLFRRLESWGQDVARDYVAAFEARDVPHLLVGGKSFHEREEVQTMRAALAAIEWPDDELSVFATLKGSLFAVGDEALLEYRHAYRHLHPFRTPKNGVRESLAPVVQALEILQELHRNRNYRPVAETIARLLHSTRAHAGFVLRPSGGQALANVLHISELARTYEEGGGISFRGFVEQLGQEAKEGQAPEAPILEEGSDGVRIMTVHKAKGLEFPVVILADVTAKLARPTASRHLDSERGLSAVKIGGWMPVELTEHDAEEAARDRAEGVRVAYVAATRARDLLVVPAIGDDPKEHPPWEAMLSDWWTSPLHAAIYPEAQERRNAGPAPACPEFGDDTVLHRPKSGPGPDNIAPGLHRFAWAPGKKKPARYDVVWWDPSRLTLDVKPKFGVRRRELLERVDSEIVARDREAYDQWKADRDAALKKGSEPSLVVRTATEYVALSGSFEGPEVTLHEIGPAPGRPAGPRYGALVHAVLATVALDANADDLAAAAELQGRILGATSEEVLSAVETVGRVLWHPLMERARRAAAQGACRRETPLTLTLPDGTLIEGVADIAFEEGGAWMVIDFKTDRELERRLDVYRRQVGLYAEAISQATGQPCTAILMRV